ncbi:MAG: AraC family transcriptional regulator [Oscillospiraceae bacterium]|nr:AraC family transcriptional regulator [Oscillospiraceae bacterium]
MTDSDDLICTISVPHRALPIQCIWDGAIYSSLKISFAPGAGYLLLYVRSGEGTLESRSTAHFLSAGSLIFLEGMHSLFLDTDRSDFSVACFLFSSSEATAAYEAYCRDNLPVIPYEKTQKLSELIAKSLQLLSDSSASAKIARSAVVSDLLEELSLCKSPEHIASARTTYYISAMKEIFDQRYSEALSLTIISKELHINKYKLAKEFKSFYGVAPIEYLISRRIEAAKKLLIGTHKTVTQIGMSIALENTPYFVKLFKAHTGLTPLKYRLHHQKTLPQDPIREDEHESVCVTHRK